MMLDAVDGYAGWASWDAGIFISINGHEINLDLCFTVEISQWPARVLDSIEGALESLRAISIERDLGNLYWTVLHRAYEIQDTWDVAARIIEPRKKRRGLYL